MDKSSLRIFRSAQKSTTFAHLLQVTFAYVALASSRSIMADLGAPERCQCQKDHYMDVSKNRGVYPQNGWWK